MGRKMLDLLFVAVVAFIVVKATTFGWRWWGYSFKPNGEIAPLAENLRQHVYVLSHEIGDRSIFKYRQLEKTAKYISEQFSSFGYDVEFQNYLIEQRVCKNIIATKKGRVKPDEIIIIGAHYDTCFNRGADDNASGVAGLLEVARAVSKGQTKQTIKFIAFVNEEPPFFKTEQMGSMVYARNALVRREDIKAVFILEMIGYYDKRPFSQRYPPLLGMFLPNRGNFIALVANFPSRPLARKIKESFNNHTDFPIEALTLPAFIPAVTFSDHYSFWRHGYPAVMFTDTAFYRNFNYHSNSDTYDKLDYKAMAAFIRGLQAVVLEFSHGIS